MSELDFAHTCVLAQVGELKNTCEILFGNLKQGDHFVDLGIEGQIILKLKNMICMGRDCMYLAEDRQ
jgi:hypothetical protein